MSKELGAGPFTDLPEWWPPRPRLRQQVVTLLVLVGLILAAGVGFCLGVQP